MYIVLYALWFRELDSPSTHAIRITRRMKFYMNQPNFPAYPGVMSVNTQLALSRAISNALS